MKSGNSGTLITSGWKRFILLALVIITPYFGHQWLKASMSDITRVRQLERIPPTDINALVAGAVRVSGHALPAEKMLLSPLTQTPTLYYRYLEERLKSSSTGSRWETLREQSRGLPFYIEDRTGKVMVEAKYRGSDQKASNQTLWFAQQKHQKVSNKRRYTEWRIDPGEWVDVTGFSHWYLTGSRILLDEEGYFTPVVSSVGAGAGRQHLGESAILQLWGGISMVSLCCFAVLLLLKQHRSIGFLSINTLILVVMLLSIGSSMIRVDIKQQIRQLMEAERAYVAMLSSVLGLDPSQKSWQNIVQAYQSQSQTQAGNTALAMMTQWQALHLRTQENFADFPDNLIAKTIKAKLPPLPVGLPTDQAKLEQIRSPAMTKVKASSPWLLVFLPFVFGLGSLWFGIRWLRDKRMMENIPTSQVLGVVPGIVEVEGALMLESADSTSSEQGRRQAKMTSHQTYHVNDALTDESFLMGPLSRKQVAWYRLVIQEKQSALNQEERWETVCDETAYVPFVCEDSTASIALDLERVNVITQHYKKEKQTNEIREEWWLEPHDSLFVIGTAKFKSDRPDALWITADKDAPYIITNRSEEALMLDKAFSGLLTLNAASSSWILVGLFVLSKAFGLSAEIMFYSAMFPLLVLILVTAVLHYNDLVFLKMRVLRNEANIETLLKKRADLFPRFEKVVKGYLAHEASLQQALAGLRQSVSTTQLDVLDQLDGRLQAIKAFTVQIEQYPQLKGHTVINRLFTLLRKVEDELALMRQGLLDAMQMYDTRRESFPDILLTKMFHFEPAKRLLK